MTKSAFDAALTMLARREHGAFELCEKLKLKGFDEALVSEVIAALKEKGYQSDLRYASMIRQARVAQGIGAVRIKQELKHSKIDDAIILQVLEEVEDDTDEHIAKVWQKKFKGVKPVHYQDVQKQKQFLRYRGFSNESIRAFFDALTTSVDS